MKKITVLLADDHTILREGLRRLLQTADDIDVVGEAANGQQAVDQVKKLHPEIIVLDLAMPLMNGVETARHITNVAPETKILVLSTYSEEEEVRAATSAGAVGYLMKETASKEILTAIREIHQGHAFFSPHISQRILRQTRAALRSHRALPDGRGSVAAQGSSLNDREMDILKLIAEGKANKEIANALSITVKTVERHRQSVMDKLHIRDAAGLTRFAIARGIIPCDGPKLVRA